MWKILLPSVLLFSVLSADVPKECQTFFKKCKRVTTIFESEDEKIFEFKDNIYRLEKGRKGTILFILDFHTKEYIRVGYRD
jgi:hypothetical protein